MAQGRSDYEPALTGEELSLKSRTFFHAAMLFSLVVPPFKR